MNHYEETYEEVLTRAMNSRSKEDCAELAAWLLRNSRVSGNLLDGWLEDQQAWDLGNGYLLRSVNAQENQVTGDCTCDWEIQ